LTQIDFCDSRKVIEKFREIWASVDRMLIAQSQAENIPIIRMDLVAD